MENYCLDIGKLVTGIGLVFDVIGVIILVRIYLTTHKIEYLKENPSKDESPSDENPFIPKKFDAIGALEGKPIELTESQHLYLYHSQG